MELVLTKSLPKERIESYFNQKLVNETSPNNHARYVFHANKASYRIKIKEDGNVKRVYFGCSKGHELCERLRKSIKKVFLKCEPILLSLHMAYR